MLSGIDWVPFLLTSVVLGFIPGPDILLAVGRSITSGRQTGVAIALGSLPGLTVHTVAAALGLSAILMTSATAFTVVKYLGAAYLIYLGLRELFSRSKLSASQGASPASLRQSFWQGFITSVFNPKTAIFFLALLPQFVQADSGNIVLEFIVLGLLFNVITLIPILGYVYLAAAFSGWLRRNPTFLRYQQVVTGTLFIGLGLRLALDRRG
jgi:threonine/homoserine/homoserine lactone efflux protein